MDPDLVRAPSVKMGAEQVPRIESSQPPERGLGGFAVDNHGHSHCVAMVATNGGVNDPDRIGEMPPHQRPVYAANVASGKSVDQRVIGPLSASHGKKAGGAHVEAVHYARAMGFANVGNLGEARK